MKRLKYFIFALMLILSFTCEAQRLLSEAASMKGVSSVYIGKAMLKLAGGASMSITGGQSGIDLSRLFKNLNSIEIISCDQKGVCDKVGKKCRSILSKYPFEVLSEVTDDSQIVEISGVFDKDGKYIELLLVAVSEDDEVSFILMKGKIDIVTLNNAIIAK